MGTRAISHHFNAVKTFGNSWMVARFWSDSVFQIAGEECADEKVFGIEVSEWNKVKIS